MQNDTITMLGGVSMAVNFRDGTSDSVFIRQLAIREYDGYLRVFDNETETIELVLKKEPGWADLLTPESHAALMDQIQELNLPFLAGWAQRRMARGKALQPDFTERMEKAMLDAATAPALAGSLPASAPDAATPPPAPLS